VLTRRPRGVLCVVLYINNERELAVLCGVIIGMTNHFRAVFDRLGGMAQAL
jgi:hypothetical protein